MPRIKETQQFLTEFMIFVRGLYGNEDFIPLHSPCFKGKEKEYLNETIDSTFVSSIGPFVNKFEEMIADYTGAKYAIATVNGTSALHSALVLAGVQTGDEVVTQSLTFVATCNAIAYCGANPVFVDVSRKTLGLSPDSLEYFLKNYGEIRNDGLCWNKHTNRVIRACIPVHNFGHPARLDKIKQWCHHYNIQLIEDAAESLGSFFNNVHTGCFGSLAAISFNGNKIITTGGGGMIITNNGNLAKKAKHITTTAKRDHSWLYIHDEVGFNYRMPNLNAAIGCAQLEMLPEYVRRKRQLSAEYAEWFSQFEYEFVTEPEMSRSNCWLNSFLANNRKERDQILEYTNLNGVTTRPAWTPMHTQKMFSHYLKMDMTNTKWIEDRLVNIPSSVVL